MGLVRCFGLYIHLDGIVERIRGLCGCCRKKKKYVEGTQNDPAAFLMATRAKTTVKRVSSYSMMASDESLDSKSESSKNQESKGMPSKKSWRRQAKKWTKKAKRKTLETKSSSEGPTKLERCIRKKTKRFKSGSEERSSKDVKGSEVEVEEDEGRIRTTSSPRTKKDFIGRHPLSSAEILRESRKRYQEREHSPGHQSGYNSDENSSKFKNSLFHKTLAEIERKDQNLKPMAQVEPMQKHRIIDSTNYTNDDHSPSVVEDVRTSKCVSKWQLTVKQRSGRHSRSPSPRVAEPVDESSSESEENDDATTSTASSTDSDSDDVTESGSDVNQGPKLNLIGLYNPAHECFGGIVVCLHELDHKMINVGILELRGLPWVGGISGFMIEVGFPPKTQRIVLPEDKGPRISVKLQVSLKIPRDTRERKNPFSRRRLSKRLSSSDDSLNEDIPLNMVRISVWGAGRVWKYGAIGHALVPMKLSVDPKPVVFGLFQQIEPTGDLGCLEVGLEFGYVETQVTLDVKVLRAKHITPPTVSTLRSVGLSRRTDPHDVWCRVSLWTEGEKIQKDSSPRGTFPHTCDPVFRFCSSFTFPKDMLPNTCVVIKVVAGKGFTEEVLGKLVVGPLLYLGSTVPPSSHPPTVALSHWGKALNHPSQVDMWHKLY